MTEEIQLLTFIVSRLLPAALDRCPRGLSGHVAAPSRSILSSFPEERTPM